MSRYDRQYDFGLRGYPQTTRPMIDRRHARYDRLFGSRYDERDFARPRFNQRVTARYNMDYIRGYSDARPVEYNMYSGDHPARTGDHRYMSRPYLTQGGTRTMRGASFPTGYDFPDYGPSYGGRYPDEL